ncbi:MAG: hypothetical protein DMD45_01225 [Gemmatimonadetes bacterium]|nr:MAG: hypothetical protein DMD45_01225 [Gemmatimonadota bacterium]
MAQVAQLPRLAHEGAISIALAACAACAPGTTEPAPARLAQPALLANPATTFNQLQAITGVTNTPLFESFTVLVPYFTQASAARSVALTALSLELAARYSPWHRGVRLTAHQPALTRCRRPRRPALTPCPPLHHADPGNGGQTFVWDATANGYVVSADSGAPATGERFVLYAISERSGLPSVPLVTTGYVDLTDQSVGDSSVRGVTLVGTPADSSPTTYASYTIGGPGAGSATSLAGFVTDGTTRLDIRADFTTTPDGLGVSTTIDVPGQDLHVSESVTVSGGSGGGDTARINTDLTLVSGGETVRATGDVTVDTTTHIGSGDMTVSVNDCPFATIALGGPDLVFTAAPGVALSTGDETTLRALFGTSFELFGTVRLLLVPSSPIATQASLSS